MYISSDVQFDSVLLIARLVFEKGVVFMKTAGESFEPKNCRGYTGDGKCCLLNVALCQKERCPFFNTQAECDKAERRLSELTDEQQKHIAKKYYGGKKPWLKESGVCRA